MHLLLPAAACWQRIAGCQEALTDVRALLPNPVAVGCVQAIRAAGARLRD